MVLSKIEWLRLTSTLELSQRQSLWMEWLYRGKVSRANSRTMHCTIYCKKWQIVIPNREIACERINQEKSQ